MNNRDNFRTKRDDGDNLGKKDHQQKVTDNPAPKEVDRESETTPPENQIDVDIEPDELHIDDEPLDVEDEEK